MAADPPAYPPGKRGRPKAAPAPKAKASSTAAPADPPVEAKAPGPQTFQLGQALGSAEQPYVNQLVALLGGGGQGSALANYVSAAGGPGGSPASPQAQSQALSALTQATVPSLGEYLKNLPPQMAQTIQAGIGSEVGALAGMPGAIQSQAQGAGSAGLLENLLNAAKYQSIYKGDLYGKPPAGGPLGQLYQQVIAGGNALTGGLNAVSPTNPTNPTKAGTPPSV